MNKTQKLTATAMLVALSVVANAFSVQISGSNYLSFTYVPSFLAAMYLGIFPAAAVGFLGDLIAGLLFPKGAYNVLIGIASTLLAVIPAVVYKVFPKHRRLNLLVSLILCTVICTCGLNTYAMWLMYGAKSGKTFWVYLWGRLPFQLLNTVVNGVIICILQESRVVDKLFGALAKNNDAATRTTSSQHEIEGAKVQVLQSKEKTTVLIASNGNQVTVCHNEKAKTTVQRNSDGSLTVTIKS